MVALIKTLEQRENASRQSFADAVARLITHLSTYGRSEGGLFYLYGSAVSGEIHDLSDVDILVDFASDRLPAALEFAEKACFDEGLSPDIRPIIWASAALRDRAVTTGRACP